MVLARLFDLSTPLNSITASVFCKMAVQQSKANTRSPLLQGNSIITQLRDGPVGRFYSNFNRIKAYLPDEDYLTLPRLIVVGTRNTGKSSVLENITKCPIFPRDVGRCTKMPLKLMMKHGERRGVTVSCDGIATPVQLTLDEDVLGTVTRMMDEAERTGDLTGKELTVEITQVSYVLSASIVS